ncbi:MAG: hypothetical protein Q8L89_04280 [Gammaproteobacteria bacterium]|nr:hypothetical protein [Gammaproteobacteria bacterium]
MNFKQVKFDNISVVIEKGERDADDGNTVYEVVQTVDIDGVTAESALGFYDEDRRDECFEKYGEEHARHFFKVISQFV